MGTVRVLPLVAFAALCLLGLKTAGMFFSGGYVLSGSAPARAQATEKTADKAQSSEDTKSAEKTAQAKMPSKELKTKESDKNAAKMPDKTADKSPDDNSEPTLGPAVSPTRSEFAVLQSLANRRKLLEKREREFQLRENLLKAAEKRIQARISELKVVEARITAQLKKQEEVQSEQFTRLVKMYSTMKPADAARIFNRLDLKILTGIVQRMKATKMAAILAAMNSNQAERLTLELASQENNATLDRSSLPKIQGKDPG